MEGIGMKRNLVCLVRLVLIGFVSVVLHACAATDSGFRVDGSTAASTGQGITTITRNLRDKKRFEFTAALLVIQLSDINSVEQLLAEPALQSFNYQKLANKINGMTYREILALAKQSKTKVKIERVGTVGL